MTLLTHSLLETIRQRLPAVDRTLRQYGRASLSAYLEQSVMRQRPGYQPHEDLGEAVYHEAAPLLGEDIARQACEELQRMPVALTANHHGVDSFAQSVQSTLLFSLRRSAAGQCMATVPVLACGSIPLNNVTYPRGLLLYGLQNAEWDALPERLPVFPDRYKRRMVAHAPAIDAAMLDRVERRVASHPCLPATLRRTLQAVFAQDYRDRAVLDCDSYSPQAVLLNARLWRRLFAPSVPAPELVYLELERVVERLLQADLSDRYSLVSWLLFDHERRAQLLRALDGARGCWRYQALQHYYDEGGKRAPGGAAACGTFLFWGVDEQGRRVPLVPAQRRDGEGVLRGVDETGRAWELPLTPVTLTQALQQRRLLPSLFTCFLATALARGITCIGGYYQADYLPRMQQGVVAVLARQPQWASVAAAVAQVPTRGYLSGMQAVLLARGEAGLLPAGPIEIMAAGGLRQDDLERMRTLNLQDAHVASLLETVLDVAPEWVRGMPAWQQRLAQESERLLQQRLPTLCVEAG